ncbi:HET-domain-containing protein [Ganoderma leucocontextum]|nr:HET-domain-containing protein [Ganoderma leucocontextum]
MWLLNTRTCELRQFLSPELVPKGYAILSHCWGRDEQTFQDVQGHMASCAKTGKNPRDFVSKKIREFCVLAESLGYEWGWADTCCIDKTSSSELSEAINSMFRYYFLSEVCIVFLHDVPTGCALDEHGPEFRDSRWHKRGWTLQELIAPKNVVFYSQDWQKLSTKVEKAPLLEEITGIPEDVLMGKKGVTEMSVAARMSWAAYRETTREEDEAYCLLGILKVDMYTSYGEGRHAFYRLQEEFIKRSTDTSLFAWGKVLKMEDVRNLQDLRLPDTIAAHHKHDLSEPFLFAPSPACCSGCRTGSFPDGAGRRTGPDDSSSEEGERVCRLVPAYVAAYGDGIRDPDDRVFIE